MRFPTPTAPNGPVAEVVTFRAAQGVDDAALLAAARATADLVRAQPGFRTRHLFCAEDGTWTDFVIWDSLAAAQAAADMVVRATEFAPYMAAVDGGSIAMSHQRLCWSMDG